MQEFDGEKHIRTTAQPVACLRERELSGLNVGIKTHNDTITIKKKVSLK